MTDTISKLRSLVLATLMVSSVFAGTVAFSGAAAAANNASVSHSPETTGEDTDFTLQADTTASYTLEQINVDLGSGVNVDSGIDRSDVQVDVAGSGQSLDSTSLSGGEIVISLSSGGVSVTSGDTITVDITGNVTNGNSGGTYTAQVSLRDSGGEQDSFSGSYSVSGSSTRDRIDDADQTVESNGLRWQGQELFLKDADAAGATYELREADSVSGGQQPGSLVTEVTLDSDGEAIIDTSLRGGLEGDYVIEDDSGTVLFFDANGEEDGTATSSSDIDDASFEVAVQTLNTEFQEESVDQGEAELEIDSNRGSYNLTVTSDNLGTSSLIDAFDDDFEPFENDDDEVEFEVTSQDETATINFSDIDTGDYTFDFDVADTDADNSASIRNNQGEDADASFRTGNTISAGEADIAEIPIEMQETDELTITIGSGDKAFSESLTVRDGDENEEVTLVANTFLMGRDTLSNGVDAYETLDDDDEIVDGSFERHVGPISNPPLDATFYEMNLTVQGNEKAIGTLSLTDRISNGITTWTAPNSEFAEADEPAEVAAGIDDGTITEDDNIAEEDAVVFEIDSTSTLGALESVNDGGDSTEEAFVDMIQGEGEVDAGAYEFSVRQEGSIANQGPLWVDLDNTEENNGLNVVPDRRNQTLYVEMRTDRMQMVRADSAADARTQDGSQSINVGPEYTANFTIGEASGLLSDSDDPDRVTIEDTFSVVDRTVEFDTEDDGRVHVNPAPGQLVTGSTSVAPGTELNLRLRRVGERGSFLKDPSPTVESDGNFQSTVDFSEEPGNITFEITVRGFDDFSEEGYIEPRRTASLNVSEQTVEVGGTVLIEDVALSEGGFIALHQDSADGEVVASSDYVEPGVEQDVEIQVSPSTTSIELVAVPHLDADGDEEFNAAFDPPYEINGSIVTVDADITFLTPTPTVTETETPDTPTVTETETQTKTDTLTPTETLTPINTSAPNSSEETTTATGPGFTALLALIALLAGAMLAGRRFD